MCKKERNNVYLLCSNVAENNTKKLLALTSQGGKGKYFLCNPDSWLQKSNLTCKVGDFLKPLFIYGLIQQELVSFHSFVTKSE